MQRRGDGLGRHRARAEWTDRHLRGEQTASAGGVNHRTRKTLWFPPLLTQVRSLRCSGSRMAQCPGKRHRIKIRGGRRKTFRNSTRTRRAICAHLSPGWDTAASNSRLHVACQSEARQKGHPADCAGRCRDTHRAARDLGRSAGHRRVTAIFPNPYSFGGIKRQKDEPLAAVPAAIKAVLDAIGAGARLSLAPTYPPSSRASRRAA